MSERDAFIWTEPPSFQRPSLAQRLLDPPRGTLAQRWPPLAAAGSPVRSFRFKAVVAFVLYFPFFLPGLIASAVWWNEANKLENRTGLTPPGKGCLTALLLWGVLVTAFWVLVFARF